MARMSEQTTMQTTMRIDRARSSLAPDAPRMAERCRVWRPFPEQVAHLLCLEDVPGDVAPRIHSQFAISLLRSPAFVMVESSRGLAAGRNQILLTPRLQLCAVRAQGNLGPGPLTLLLDASDLEGLAVPDRPALVTDQECVGQLAALIGQLQRPVGLLGREAIPRSLLERLFARSAPLEHARSCGRSLAPVRRHLHDHPWRADPDGGFGRDDRPHGVAFHSSVSPRIRLATARVSPAAAARPCSRAALIRSIGSNGGERVWLRRPKPSEPQVQGGVRPDPGRVENRSRPRSRGKRRETARARGRPGASSGRH